MKVSRPHLVKLLETGKIPYKMVGSHRSVLPEVIQKYDSALRKTRRKALDLLAQEAQEMGLGYLSGNIEQEISNLEDWLLLKKMK